MEVACRGAGKPWPWRIASVADAHQLWINTACRQGEIHLRYRCRMNEGLSMGE